MYSLQVVAVYLGFCIFEMKKEKKTVLYKRNTGNSFKEYKIFKSKKYTRWFKLMYPYLICMDYIDFTQWENGWCNKKTLVTKISHRENYSTVSIVM